MALLRMSEWQSLYLEPISIGLSYKSYFTEENPLNFKTTIFQSTFLQVKLL